MKLNLDCVRSVLLAVEGKPLGKPLTVENLKAITKFSEEDIIYTCLKLDEAGFLEVITIPIQRQLFPGIKSVNELTFQGHEFLETIRPDDVWDNTKAKLKKLGSFSLGIIQSVASSVLSSKIQELF